MEQSFIPFIKSDNYNLQLGDDINLKTQIKRPRGGSISGRLRAASDLADFGLIDSAQKGLLKVISSNIIFPYMLQ